MTQIESSPRSAPTPDKPSTNGSRATCVFSTPFCRFCFEKSHRQAQCSFIPYHLMQSRGVKRKNVLKSHFPRPQGRLQYQMESASNREPHQVLAQQSSVQSMQPQLTSSVSKQSKSYRREADLDRELRN